MSLVILVEYRRRSPPDAVEAHQDSFSFKAWDFTTDGWPLESDTNG